MWIALEDEKNLIKRLNQAGLKQMRANRPWWYLVALQESPPETESCPEASSHGNWIHQLDSRKTARVNFNYVWPTLLRKLNHNDQCKIRKSDIIHTHTECSWQHVILSLSKHGKLLFAKFHYISDSNMYNYIIPNWFLRNQTKKMCKLMAK